MRATETAAQLRVLLRERFAGRIALVASFGAESAVLLHMVATIDRATPVISLDTGKLFPETLVYRAALARRLGLADLRLARPAPAMVARADPAGTLWRDDPDACCRLRKVAPLEQALAPFDAWISGRRRSQGDVRATLAPVEFGTDWRFTINPLSEWEEADIAAYFARYDLPPHPLAAAGYRSIGCAPCTRATRSGEPPRAGRWDGSTKTECGIHAPPPSSERLSA